MSESCRTEFGSSKESQTNTTSPVETGFVVYRDEINPEALTPSCENLQQRAMKLCEQDGNKCSMRPNGFRMYRFVGEDWQVTMKCEGSCRIPLWVTVQDRPPEEAPDSANALEQVPPVAEQPDHLADSSAI